MHRRVFSKRDYNIPQVAEKIRGISGKATLAIGAVEIPVDNVHPIRSINQTPNTLWVILIRLGIFIKKHRCLDQRSFEEVGR